MTPSTKVFSLLSLSGAIGMILAKNDDERISWRGKKLQEAGIKATMEHPYSHLDASKIKQIEKKVNEICQDAENINIVETLSFLLCGLVDLRAHMKPSNWLYLDPVLRRVQWAMDLFDDHDNEYFHIEAYRRYEKWVTT